MWEVLQSIDPEKISVFLNLFTFTACAIIIGFAFWANKYVNEVSLYEYKDKKEWIDQLPSIASTLGVLGTFLGITIGLVFFNEKDLTNSIPQLLSGLRTAFFTSLCGMISSMLLNRKIVKRFSSAEKETEIQVATKKIIDVLTSNNNALINKMSENSNKLENALTDNKLFQAIREDVIQIKDDIEEIKGRTQEYKHVLDDINDSNTELPRILGVLTTATASLSSMDNVIKDICSEVAIVSKNANEITDLAYSIDTKAEQVKDDIEKNTNSLDDIMNAVLNIRNNSIEEDY